MSEYIMFHYSFDENFIVHADELYWKLFLQIIFYTSKNKWNGHGNENLISNFTNFKCNLKFEKTGSKYLPFLFNLFGQN